MQRYPCSNVFFSTTKRCVFWGPGALTKITVGHEAGYAKKLFLSHNGCGNDSGVSGNTSKCVSCPLALLSAAIPTTFNSALQWISARKKAHDLRVLLPLKKTLLYMLVGFSKLLKFSKNVIYAGRHICWLDFIKFQKKMENTIFCTSKNFKKHFLYLQKFQKHCI